jgi:hypothetical protein
VFLILGGFWGTFTVLTAGPWPLMLISAATMMGPGFLRLWLSGPATGANFSSPPPEPLPPSSSPSPGPTPATSGAE